MPLLPELVLADKKFAEYEAKYAEDKVGPGTSTSHFKSAADTGLSRQPLTSSQLDTSQILAVEPQRERA